MSAATGVELFPRACRARRIFGRPAGGVYVNFFHPSTIRNCSVNFQELLLLEIINCCFCPWHCISLHPSFVHCLRDWYSCRHQLVAWNSDALSRARFRTRYVPLSVTYLWKARENCMTLTSSDVDNEIHLNPISYLTNNYWLHYVFYRFVGQAFKRSMRRKIECTFQNANIP